MSLFERLLEPGCIELPACACVKEMHIANLDPIPQRNDAHIRVYNCPACHHEMRLTVWATDMAASFTNKKAPPALEAPKY
jgi:hypothetical protein